MPKQNSSGTLTARKQRACKTADPPPHKKGGKKGEPRVKAYIPLVLLQPVAPDSHDALGLAYSVHAASLPAEFVFILRQLGKKAAVTKRRALEELKTPVEARVAEQDDYVVRAMLPAWGAGEEKDWEEAEEGEGGTDRNVRLRIVFTTLDVSTPAPGPDQAGAEPEKVEAEDPHYPARLLLVVCRAAWAVVATPVRRWKNPETQKEKDAILPILNHVGVWRVLKDPLLGFVRDYGAQPHHRAIRAFGRRQGVHPAGDLHRTEAEGECCAYFRDAGGVEAGARWWGDVPPSESGEASVLPGLEPAADSSRSICAARKVEEVFHARRPFSTRAVPTTLALGMQAPRPVLSVTQVQMGLVLGLGSRGVSSSLVASATEVRAIAKQETAAAAAFSPIKQACAEPSVAAAAA
ncbi:hypothetical protein FIBSPDRAFT_901807 [Athelia psychrophila]|uniref:Uncharacterized protein n=1 Tax=Athelia psychrophila TaxID=1759441 RepID=A0A165WQ73_9AGAM|nr:hypothetical protein FIBSPDRAFT_901807 [Fibularhizoctonia sp. CBS 109695]